MNQSSFRVSVGDFECIALRDATDVTPWKSLVSEAYESAVTRVLSERGLTTTEVSLDYLCLFVRARRELVVIDTGCGCTEGVQGEALATLRAEGVSLQGVTLVIITHHDRDHLAGVVAPDGTLAFPNARHIMTQVGWAWHTSEKNLAAMPEAHAAFHRTIRSLLEGRVVLVHGETEVAPGIRIIPAPGHRPGHVAVQIVSQGKRLWHLADTIVHPIFVEHPEWGSRFDSTPDEALATRRRFLDIAATEGPLLFLSHFPFPGLGYVTGGAGTRHWQPVGDKPKA
ncbi:MAG: MBL fold metallo-hydrolase [Candidatus Bipolaricaulota bacterium]|nr:MBL fold metallo-hydrolase [Candidatus Bipolaricaulota bacterium]